jgi:succinate dehydrogenase / fumarate reductase cytochrome b subunit
MAEQRAPVAARPLSPHVQIYRWPVTMGTSIIHRITGFGLALGTLILAWWLVAAALGPDAYATFQAVAYHWFGRLVLFGFTLALVFHAVNGVRHLCWDLGFGFAVPTASRTGIIVYVLTIVLTWIIWALAYHAMGKL